MLRHQITQKRITSKYSSETTIKSLYSYQKLSQLYFLVYSRFHEILLSWIWYATLHDKLLRFKKTEQRLLYTVEHGREEEITATFQEWFSLMKSLHYNSLRFFYTKLYSGLRDRIRFISLIPSLTTYQFENKLSTTTDILHWSRYLTSHACTQSVSYGYERREDTRI